VGEKKSFLNNTLRLLLSNLTSPARKKKDDFIEEDREENLIKKATCQVDRVTGEYKNSKTINLDVFWPEEKET